MSIIKRRHQSKEMLIGVDADFWKVIENRISIITRVDLYLLLAQGA